ncbi:eotaxin-like [Rhinatrema bivittatum]|uniref:eotaxin-like n=1 Tax=Rhinatrema bivittatum TaxID=194408 RepID=UPI001128C74F|nr:eotaxin-like [Rhinatrema bivittatum]
MSVWILPVLAVLLCVTTMQGSDSRPIDCCMSIRDENIPIGRLQAYEIQRPEGSCHSKAVVFITKTNRRLCAPSDAKWVKNRMKQLDKMKINPNMRKGKDRKKKQKKSKTSKGIPATREGGSSRRT